MSTHLERTLRFNAMHVRSMPIVLPNVWDVASARVVVAAGARAIATTSAGVAWSSGYSDGNELTRDSALFAAERIVAAVDAPVTVDIERGYGETPDDVAATIRAFLEIGVVGVNLEDSRSPIDQQEQRIRAARDAAEETGIPLFINARIDTHLRGDVGSDEWMEETFQRAAAYTDAGASGVFVLGALPADKISALVNRTALPLNVAFGPGTLSIGDLSLAGASRISAGSAIAEVAYSSVQEWASTMCDQSGAVISSPPALGWAALNRIMHE